MLVDAHIHTAGISLCSRIPAPQLVDICLADRLGGIVLTNHYKAAHVCGDFDTWRRRYVEEYEITRELGAKKGLKVFFGVEVTPDEMPQNDFTIYGLTPEDILTSDPLFRLSLKDLSEFVHKRHALLYHAHPFRRTEPVDAAFLDGTEINCHPLYRTCAEEKVRAFADANRLRLSCGSDYHGDTYKAHCGMWIPQSIETTEAFTGYLRENMRPALLIAPDPEEDTPIAPGMGRLPRSLENGRDF